MANITTNRVGALTLQTYETIEDIDSNKLATITQLYTNVFAGEPWNEYKICTSNTKHYFGRDVGDHNVCRFCEGSLDLYYPFERTKEKIKRELSGPNSILCTSETDTGDVLGAGWGLSYTPTEFAEKKYRTEEMKERVVNLLQGLNGDNQLFYLSEMMVHESARQRGLGTLMAKQLNESANSIHQKTFLRTSRDSHMARIAQNLRLREILSPGEDAEHAQRVIFYGP